ncbi:MAG TPA: DNA adenine methylase [Caldilineaceae bacterium]|nr:DNA adenine methylase [Caldilineaceae bacterium]
MALAGEGVARPFLKWAGGKSQLLAQLAAHYPPGLAAGEIERYVEPFLGGGAVFLEIAQHYPVRSALLSDANPELVLVYRVVQQDVEGLIERLERLAHAYLEAGEPERQALYYRIRARYNEQRRSVDFSRYSAAWVERAALMLFLNKTCYNGLFRVNRQGAFNVPFGRYKQPTICDATNLRAVARLLQRAKLQVAPYTACEAEVDDRTFVYFDPPYRPISPTSSFTAYSCDKFDDADQEALAAFFARLHDRTGAKLMLSNSDPANVDPDDDFFTRLYSRFHIHRVWANRMINTQADKRGKISELLITNYG